ncbi:MAG: oligoendopeptidase F [Clostridiales bacterium]|nr:oligoendopeptidase F [Clostridiales bacterium]
MVFTRKNSCADARGGSYDAEREAVRSGWRLFVLRLPGQLRAFYLRGGLALLVLTTAGIFLAAAYAEPALLGSVRGGYRADVILFFGGIGAVVLAGLVFAYLLPRAVTAAYEDYALSCFGPPRRGVVAGEAATRAFLRLKGVYWWVLLVRLCMGALLALGAWAASRWMAGRFSAQSWGIPAVWSLAVVLFWQSRHSTALALAAAARERVSGVLALRRGLRLHRRVRGVSSLVGLITLFALMLLSAGVLALSMRLANGHTLVWCSIAAFLTALLVPPLRLLLAAFDTAVYAAASCGCPGVSRWYYSARGVRNTSEKRKGQTGMKTRDQIDASLKWNLNDIYASEDLWEADYAAAQALVRAFPEHAGKLSTGADSLYAALCDESRIEQLIDHVYSYAHLHKDEDNGSAHYQGMTDRAIQLYVSAQAAGSFLEPEMLTIPEETLLGWATGERFARFRFRIADVDRRRAHTLSTEEERLLAMAEEPLAGADNIFTMLTDVDLDYGTVTDETGKEVKLTHGSYNMFLVNPDRRVRKDAYETFYKAYFGVKNTLNATYSTSVKSDVFRARTHRFDGALEAALYLNGVPVAVYEQLIEAVHEMLPVLKKYLGIRKRVLGVERLEMYDLYVPITEGGDIDMPYEDAKALVKTALKPLGEEYGKLLDEAYTQGWIDVYETPGKTSGAFCAGIYGTHPYVLLNYQGKMDDAFTLGHELGHAMHSHYSDTAQPFETSHYRILAAEVASTVNETLMTHYLLANEQDRTKRAYYITQFLESFRTTCFRQTMFAEFELKAHRMAQSGEPLTVESLSAMYRALNELYYDGAHVDDNIALEWMRVPHFYNAFYVYQYATGLCSAVKLADDILHGGAVERYTDFLKSGGSDYPIEELKAAGVDLTKKESILASLEVFRQYVDELDELLK